MWHSGNESQNEQERVLVQGSNRMVQIPDDVRLLIASLSDSVSVEIYDEFYLLLIFLVS